MKLIQFIIAPLMLAILAAVAATFIIYQLLTLAPGMLPMNVQAKPASYTEWLFGSFSSRGVVNGDFGDSIAQRRSAYELTQERWPASLELFIPAVWQSLLLGTLLGILLALLRRWLTDGFLRPFFWLGISTPTFWLALMLVLIFAIQRQEFPVSGRCAVSLTEDDCPDIQHLILPLRTLVLHWTCIIALFIRSAILPFLQKDPDGGFKGRYIVDGILLPLLSLIPGFLVGLASTQLLVETVFAWPGVGRLAVSAASARDMPVLGAVIMQTVLWVIAVFFITTMLQGLIRWLIGEAPKVIEMPKPEVNELASDSLSSFAESENPPLKSSIRPFIDKLYTALAVVAALVVLGITLASIQPSILTSADPLTVDPAARLQFPGAEGHPYGTDDLGSDEFARLLAGGRITLIIAFTAALVALVIGSVVGFVGGLFMESLGVLLNIPINTVIIGINLLPILPLLLLLAGVFQLDQNNLPLFLGLLVWGHVAMIVRTKVAAAMSGHEPKQSIWRWLLLPIYALALNMAVVITIESGLSFLGFGVQPPLASWGSMIASGRNYLARADYLVIFPGLLIVLTVFCLNVIASRIQDNEVA